MRKTPSLEAEVVSQALFGETVDQNGEEGDWFLVTTPDQYQGWVPSSSVAAVLTDESAMQRGQTTRLSVPLYCQKTIRKGPLFQLPFGVFLEVLDMSDPLWIAVALPDGRRGYVQKGTLSFSKNRVKREDLYHFVSPFLGIPYLWGGRSSFGFDCSGFVQMVFAEMGMLLPRDSGDQYRDLRAKRIENPVLGDLIFWGESEKKIGHVAIFLEEGKFIHTSSREHQPWLRISKLTDLAWSTQEGSAYPYRSFHRFPL